MTMRRETIRALEVRKNSIMAERNKSAMQTLGANNEYAINPNALPNAANLVPLRSGRISNAGISVKDVFDPNGGPANGSHIYGHTGSIGGIGGQTNHSYEHDDVGGNAMQMNARSQVSWGNSNMSSSAAAAAAGSSSARM